MKRSIERPVSLILLDGWGYSPDREGNAIASAHTPHYDEICRRFPRALLTASGSPVGLKDGIPGGPESGYLNIGAGRAAETEATRIGRAIESGELLENKVLVDAIKGASTSGAAIHLIGLISDGGVHSTTENLYELLRLSRKCGAEKVYVHCILDGRDVPPQTADIYVEALEMKMRDIGVGCIASACGRYFAMDTEENWERTARAFTMLIHAEGDRAIDAGTSIRSALARGISDEFVEPIIIEDTPGRSGGRIMKGDAAILINHRGDGMRQLAKSLASADIDTICMVEYDASLNLPVAFPSTNDSKGLAAAISRSGSNPVAISETFRAQEIGRLIGTDAGSVLFKTASGALTIAQPESCSFRIADAAIRTVRSDGLSTVLISFPAADIAAKTGDLDRTIEAIQYVDTCLGGVVDAAIAAGGFAVITSTHGRCESVVDPFTGDAVYQTSSNPVPFHLVGESLEGIVLRENGALEDVAPTILGLMNISKPSEMTGIDLRML